MSDLISRSELIKELNKYCGNQRYLVSENIREIINNQPTSYDIDNVVEELEENASRYTKKYVTHYGNNGYRDVKAISVNRAIEIVKHGCVGTETETIRDKAVKWNNNSSKRVPYEFIDYVEGKREICVDDVCGWKYNDSEYYFESSCKHLQIFMSDGPKENEYRFCPYCGKKIKIVGD